MGEILDIFFQNISFQIFECESYLLEKYCYLEASVRLLRSVATREVFLDFGQNGFSCFEYFVPGSYQGDSQMLPRVRWQVVVDLHTLRNFLEIFDLGFKLKG